MASPPYTLYFGTFVHLPREKSGLHHELAIHRGALWVSNDDGRIQGVDWSVEGHGGLLALVKSKGWVVAGTNTSEYGFSKKPRVRIVTADEEKNEFFFPGFIDTHIHAPQYPNSGLFGTLTLLEWLQTYTFPMEKSFQDVHRARTVYKQVISRTLANGTTCASYFATIHVPATNLLATLCKQAGQRALIGRVCMDRVDEATDYRDPSTEASVALNRDVIRHIHAIDPHGDHVQPILTPRFALACTEDAMDGLAALAADYDPPLHIQTHISENKNEVAAVEAIYGMSYADVYATHGLLTPRTILAHAVHLSDTEKATIAARGAKVSHCPASNSALGSGLCPVRSLLDAGIQVGLGTDVSGGYDASVLENVRQACLVSRLYRHTDASITDDEAQRLVLSVGDALYLATRGGAAVVDLADQVGGFDVGMSWDAQLISLGEKVSGETKGGEENRVDVFGTEDWGEKVEKWVWNGDDRNVSAVWVHGKLVHRREGLERYTTCGSSWGWIWGVGAVSIGAFVALRRLRG
ncbi:atrazine chlorohydrolase/guanine deaminase [Aspergillus steynii IBT 23096]|uniref:Probable guanine deaminase n=1 Tax=Aspergillus steynii IBT 23096 TaxID=1392250 RepID=A0A2I2GCL9_9EURO|nr:atrazine chlorohydrolase/guanine deaminase [Aspergillus steynii IBT 23096]PLB50636.1 atrazine chlorohydrolase/guanine deaminase [Aspergillus steynii IBT 23096]